MRWQGTVVADCCTFEGTHQTPRPEERVGGPTIPSLTALPCVRMLVYDLPPKRASWSLDRQRLSCGNMAVTAWGVACTMFLQI